MVSQGCVCPERAMYHCALCETTLGLINFVPFDDVLQSSTWLPGSRVLTH